MTEFAVAEKKINLNSFNMQTKIEAIANSLATEYYYQTTWKYFWNVVTWSRKKISFSWWVNVSEFICFYVFRAMHCNNWKPSMSNLRIRVPLLIWNRFKCLPPLVRVEMIYLLSLKHTHLIDSTPCYKNQIIHRSYWFELHVHLIILLEPETVIIIWFICRFYIWIFRERNQ